MATTGTASFFRNEKRTEKTTTLSPLSPFFPLFFIYVDCETLETTALADAPGQGWVTFASHPCRISNATISNKSLAPCRAELSVYLAARSVNSNKSFAGAKKKVKSQRPFTPFECIGGRIRWGKNSLVRDRTREKERKREMFQRIHGIPCPIKIQTMSRES